MRQIWLTKFYEKSQQQKKMEEKYEHWCISFNIQFIMKF